jgi:hypothetical protein
MPVRSKCSKGSEVSLSRVPSQWCGSGDARGALVLIGGETSPGVWRDEMESFGCPADHCVWCIYMGRQARRHSCMSLPMLVSILRAVPRVASM